MSEYNSDYVNSVILNEIMELRGNKEKWIDFLKTVAWNYMFSFGNQLSIYHHNPTATAVTSELNWKKRYSANINKGATAIPIIFDNNIGNSKNNVRLVFDVSDTNYNKERWRFNAESPQFLNYINSQYKIEAKDIYEAIDKIIVIGNEKPEGVFAENSIKYAIYTRLDLPTENLLSKLNFDYIQNDIEDYMIEVVGATLTYYLRDFFKNVEQYANIIAQEKQKQQRKEEDTNATSSKNNIIGNTSYYAINKRRLRKLSNEVAGKVIEEFENTNIKFSGKVNNDGTTTITVGNEDLPKLLNILSDISKTLNTTDENPTQIEQDFLIEKENKRKNLSFSNSNHISFSSEDIQIARSTNLIDYLSSRGENLIRVGTKEYTMSNHDSMRINGSQWYWNSRNIGGNSLDFLMDYYNLDFQSSIIELLRFNGYSFDENTYSRPQFQPTIDVITKKDEIKPLPTYPFSLDKKTNRVYAYLTKTRNLSSDIVKYVLDAGLVAQDIKGNAVFNIYDENNNISGAEIVGTYKPDTGRSYRHISEQNGNGFRLNIGSSSIKKALFFESAIDLLSYYNLHRDEDALLISMTGLKDKVVLKTMQDYSLFPEQCYISSDNDEAGKNFAEKCAEKYGTNTYRVNNEPIFANYPDIKDWNDLLSAVKQFDALLEAAKTNQPVSENASTLSPIKYKITEADIADVLQYGTNQPDGKTDIASLYDNIRFSTERVSAIEQKYGIGTSPITFADGSNGYVEYNSVGLIIRKGDYLTENAAELHLPWSDVEKRIRALIANNNYLINDEEVIITEPPRTSVESSSADNPLDIESNKNETPGEASNENSEAEKTESADEPKPGAIIGNTVYKYVPQKKYRKLPTSIAINVASELEKRGYKFSGRINDDGTTTLTFDGTKITDVKKIINNINAEENSAQIEQNSEDEKTANKNNLPELSDYVLNNMPDDTVTIAARNEFGYTDNHLLPISKEKALELFSDNKLSVFLLYPDNTEGQVYSKEDILSHNGMYGIETEEWESYITPPLEVARKAAEEQGLVFSTKFSNDAADDFNPYVYDGTMSLEDFNKVQDAYFQEEKEKSFAQPVDEVLAGKADRKSENAQIELLNKAINHIKETHSFSDKTEKLLDNAFKLSTTNNITTFDLSIFEDIRMKDKYGPLTRINEKYFDGNLYSIANEINNYINDYNGSTKNIEDKIEVLENTEENNSYIVSPENNANNIRLTLVGNFYEAYGDEAIRMADILDISYTTKSDGTILAGFPDFALNENIKLLKNNGCTVTSIAEDNDNYNIQSNVVTSDDEVVDEVEIDAKSNNEPYVYVEWSEHKDIADETRYSLSDFNTLVADLDAKMIAGREAALKFYGSDEAWSEADYETDDYREFKGYYKTSFEIRNLPNEDTYSGRYDIGDGDGTLINHIKLVNQSNLDIYSEQDDVPESSIKQRKYILDVLVPYLETYISLEDNERQIAETQDIVPIRKSNNSELPLALENHDTIHFLNKSDGEDENIILNSHQSKVTNESIVYTTDGYILYGDVEKNGATIEESYLKNLGKDIPAIINYIEKNGYKVSTIESTSIFDVNTSVHNYHIDDDEFTIDTPKINFKKNIEAIKVLKDIEQNNRQATVSEQNILAKYVGWGGLKDAFNNQNNSWINEYTQLRTLLTESEYTAARASIISAHYTPTIIIDTMYKALNDVYGFNNGTILEPSMGIGNFFGRLPENMSNSKLYGVELDNLTGRIAKQLYPNAHIDIKGFEETTFTSNTFDIAIGNVPFGEYTIHDKDFNKDSLIHDYFFKKALDKVHPGGIVAFITTKGTLDKKDSSTREFLAERADLLGAIRLPNTAFKNANTSVTSDILFLQKREVLRDLSLNRPEWIDVTSVNGIEINSYFATHPQMIMGEMTTISGRYGQESTCKPFSDIPIEKSLSDAIGSLKADLPVDYKAPSDYNNYIHTDDNILNDNIVIPDVIPENYRNFCYAVIDDKIYFRENRNFIPQNFEGKKAERLKGLIEISESLRDLITYQKDNYSDIDIENQQVKLNSQYESFVTKFGRLNSKTNKSLFKDDDTSQLLLSLEILDNKGNFESKADIFTKRTIAPVVEVSHVDTASEALILSVSERVGIDFEYMTSLCGKSKEEIISELKGIIFENPDTQKYETADEYLSGNVRLKLATAKEAAEKDDKYSGNVSALEAVQPEDLTASEINVQLGSTWIPVQYYQQFMYELLDTPDRCRQDSEVYFGKPYLSSGAGSNKYIVMLSYNSDTATFGISNKTSYSADGDNYKANNVYGTDRINAYKIIEDTLNLKIVKIFDYIEDAEGKTHAVLNEKDTMLAQEKQNIIKDKFQEWIWNDYDRTQDLVKIYNEKFNSIRPREYDGSHLRFVGMNPEIKLKKHQVDAIAHTIYGGNTLLAHTVGAGKTFEMVASAMESKRLGLCTKSLIAVPKAIVSQIAKEFLQLYPTANILVPNEKDFSSDNRKRFCSRIATGNYDAIIISHNQLEKIPLSKERQINFVQSEINEIVFNIAKLEASSNQEYFSIRQLEITKKNLETRLKKLINEDKRDSTITFEELGIDKLYVDEADLFKNLYFNTKIGRNVAGINANSASQRAEDLYMKIQYLDEITNSKGTVFATGTPISNSISEMYTMQKYLQQDFLKSIGLNHFDTWVSNFAETKLSMELSPEGKGYQLKNRFARFVNLPELTSMFKEVADVKTADMLNLPVPKANYHTIAIEASEYQKNMVDGLAERAKRIRNREVSSKEDNMLNVTNDGKKLALDQRLLNPMLPDDENSKSSVCVENVFKIWSDTMDTRSTQLIFSDLSTPHYDDNFNVYDDIKQKLILKGIPSEEIAYIHDAKTDAQREALFSSVRNGNVRILLGSTNKLGTGTNVQTLLKAVHHLDCPWRPRDLEQRNGRIIRQGNTNSEVDIFSYVTKGTFDSYLYQTIENKQRFISQILTSKSPARAAEDIDESVLSYAQIKAIASDNPKIVEKMNLDIEVTRLRALYSDYKDNKIKLQEDIAKNIPKQIQQFNELIEVHSDDAQQSSATKSDEFTNMIINNTRFVDKKEAGEALVSAVRKTASTNKSTIIGEYRGFTMTASFNSFSKDFEVELRRKAKYVVEIKTDIYANINRIDSKIDSIPLALTNVKEKLENAEKSLLTAKAENQKPFDKMEELREKEHRLNVLNKELTSDNISSDTPQKDKDRQQSTVHTRKKFQPCL